MSDKTMAVNRTIISSSSKGFNQAIKAGFERAQSTLRNVIATKVTEKRISINDQNIAEFRVTLEVVFILES